MVDTEVSTLMRTKRSITLISVTAVALAACSTGAGDQRRAPAPRRVIRDAGRGGDAEGLVGPDRDPESRHLAVDRADTGFRGERCERVSRRDRPVQPPLPATKRP